MVLLPVKYLDGFNMLANKKPEKVIVPEK